MTCGWEVSNVDDYTLSNNSKTVTAKTDGSNIIVNGDRDIDSTTYWEIRINSGSNIDIGISANNNDIFYYINGINRFQFKSTLKSDSSRDSNKIKDNNTQSDIIAKTGIFQSGDIVGLLLDKVNNKLHFYHNSISIKSINLININEIGVSNLKYQPAVRLNTVGDKVTMISNPNPNPNDFNSSNLRIPDTETAMVRKAGKYCNGSGGSSISSETLDTNNSSNSVSNSVSNSGGQSDGGGLSTGAIVGIVIGVGVVVVGIAAIVRGSSAKSPASAGEFADEPLTSEVSEVSDDATLALTGTSSPSSTNTD